MRYAVVQIALMKAGRCLLLPSPRNSQSGQESLFKSTACRLLLYSAGVERDVDDVASVLPEVRSFQIPEFDDLCAHLHQSQGYQEGMADDQVVVLHTSGSTGHPKPIYHTNASINTVGALKGAWQAEGRQNIQDAFLESDKSMLIVTPFFHIMGQTMLWRSLLCRAPLVILSPLRPSNPELLIEAIQQVRPSLAFFPPSILEGIVAAPEGLEAIGLLENLFFAGGPLAPSAGEKLITGTNLLNMLGSTETGICPSRVPLDRQDWAYYEIIPESGSTMEVDSSGLYELVIKRTHQNERYQAVFHTQPKTREWRTKDLFERHPDPGKKDLWLYKGRKDDLLVLSNGEKFNPVSFEKLVESHPTVKGALVVGQGRFQTGLLIEPDWNAISPAKDPSEILNLVWPTVEKANASSPAHSKVWKSRIALAKRDKPFKRAPKGSVIRRQTVELYAAEIDALYFERKDFNDDQLEVLPEHIDIPAVKQFLRQTFKLRDLPIAESCSDDQDIFNDGIDSLQVLELCHAVNRALGIGSGLVLSAKDVYSYPTINGLAEFVHRSISAGGPT